MSIAQQPTLSPQGQAFVDSVENAKYDRQITSGIQKFIDKTVPEDMQGFYTDEQLQALIAAERDGSRYRIAHARQDHSSLL